jgi:ornithine cyclodeaminase/alanine dehydrogenase-like protein (mu-crystallin family)
MIKIINKEDVEKSITMKEAIEVMEDAFTQFSKNKVIVPQRSIIKNEFGVKNIFIQDNIFYAFIFKRIK